MSQTTNEQSTAILPVDPWRAHDGPLTRDLVLEPGKFGLGHVPRKLQPDATTGMVCGFCSTGCSLNVHLRDGEAINLTPSPDYPVNLGMACPKGWEALSVLQSHDRATTPLVREHKGTPRPVDWDTALTTFCNRFQEIQRRHGNASVAFLSTGQMSTEEMALLGSLAKFGMGILHGDGNTRQCMATAVVAYKQAFGFDAPPYTYQDFEESDVIVESQRGRVRAKAFVTPTIQPGQVFIPMHYEATNQLTLAHFDPYSHQPSYKNCAVRVRRAEPWDDV